MKRLLCAILVLSCATALAGPARPVRSTTFTPPAAVQDGPPLDPVALQGQWFTDINVLDETASTWEFHDEENPLSIMGVVTDIQWGTNYFGGTNIVGFTVEATVVNNLSSDTFGATTASNAHGEVQLPPQPLYTNTMKRARIVAEFAVAEAGPGGPPHIGFAPFVPGMAPPYYLDPGSGNQYCIEAMNEHLAAWYCYTDMDPQNPQNPPGAYYVPAWELGDIPPGGSKNVTMDFKITAYGGGHAEMPITDIRHSVIRYSNWYGGDVLYNRNESLKISHWIDLLLIDGGQTIYSVWPPWLLEELQTNNVEYVSASDASVFFDTTWPGEKAVLEITPIATNQSPDAIQLDWTALDAIDYHIQYTDQLSTNTLWTTLFPGLGIPAVIPSPMQWIDDGTVAAPPVWNQPQRFYRLVEP